MKKGSMNERLFWRGFSSGIRMLFTLFCLLVVVGTLPTSAKAYSQRQKLDISVSDVSLEEFMRIVKQQAKVDFLYNIREIESNGKVSMKMSGATVQEVLKEAFKGKNLDFVIEDNLIVIRPTSGQTNQKSEKIVQGVIKSESGEPIPGASIMLKGTNVGVISDANGHFKLPLPTTDNVVLRISFVGMMSKEVTYKNEVVLTVVLEEEIASLDEVVITGYQVLDKRLQTSAITSVKAADILVPGMMSIDAALEGQIPELMVMTNSGEVGATPRLRLRGTTTLLGNREPLWVVDGFPIADPVAVSPEDLNNPDYLNVIGNAIAGLNPQDIERIDVLKDASATALYGVRASNGVIVVTTKKGERGKARFSYNHSSKFVRRPRYSDKNVNLMNSSERVKFGKDLCDLHYVFPEKMTMVGYEGAYYRYQNGQTTFDEFQNEVRAYESANTDWFDILTRDSYAHSHTVSVSGGSDAMTYYVSLGYNSEDGVSKTTYMQRYTTRVNLDARLSPKFNMNLGFSGNIQKKNNLQSKINAMEYAYNTTRALPCYNEDGSLYYYQAQAYKDLGLSSKQSNTYRYNILNEIENSSSGYNGNSINANLNLKYKPYKWVDLTVQGDYSRSNTLQEQWWGERSYYVAKLKNGEYEEAPTPGMIVDGAADGGDCELPYGGILTTQNTINDNYTLRLQANLRGHFGGDNQHLVTSNLIFEARSSKYIAYNDENRGYMKERGLKIIDYSLEDMMKYPFYATWLGKNHRTIANSITNNLSGAAALSYSYKSLFTFYGNMRMEVSNKFGDQSRDRMLPIWSVSAMFNFKRAFMEESEWLNDLSLRTSYGVQGNMLDSESPNLVINRKPIDAFYNENVSIVARYPNPNLKWEKTQNVNVSLDFRCLESRLGISGSYYYRKTTDNFQNVTVSSVNGVTNYQMNNGDVSNEGYSISLDVTPIKTNDFTFRFTTYYSGNFNTVKTGSADSYKFGDYLAGTAIVSGESIETFYSYKLQGLSPVDGVPMFNDYADRRYLLENKTQEETIKMTMEKSGVRTPKFSGSLHTYFTYKRLSLSMDFSYSLGYKVRLFSLYQPILDGVRANNNVRKEFSNRWVAPGDEAYTNVPSIISTSSADYGKYRKHYSMEGYDDTNIYPFASSIWNMYDNSDIRVVSGNHVKCTALRLSYNLPTALLRNTPFTYVSVSANATNLFTLTSKALNGQDPSQAGFASPNMSIRPSYSLGVNVSF